MGSRTIKRQKLEGVVALERAKRPTCTILGPGACDLCGGKKILSNEGVCGISADQILKYAENQGGVCPHQACGRPHCLALMKANQSAGSIPRCLSNVQATDSVHDRYIWKEWAQTQVCDYKLEFKVSIELIHRSRTLIHISVFTV